MFLAMIFPFTPLKSDTKGLTNPPQFIQVHSDLENSALNISCTGEPPFSNLICQIIQLNLDIPTDDSISKNAKAFIKDLAATRSARTDLEKQLLLIKKDCPRLQKEWKAELAKELNQFKRQHLESEEHQVRELCNSQDSDDFIKNLKKQSDYSAKICKVRAHMFTLEFKRISQRKWLSNSTGGLCSTTVVTTLEHEKNETHLWTYSQTRVAGETEGPLCSVVGTNQTVTYSWRSRNGMSLPCDSAEFGM